MNTAFYELAIVLGLSCLIGFLIKYLKQPLLMAYLLAGVVISLIAVINPQHSLPLTFLPDFGIAFVLFFIGMELDLRELKSLGLPIIVSGLVQITIASVLGYSIASLLGFNQTDSLYLGMGLSFSSTIVVVKMLLERKDLTSLYGKLSLGVLLLEDMVAIMFIMGLTVGSSFLHLGFQNAFPILALVGKAGVLFVLSFVLSRWVLHWVFKAVAENAELLFLTSLAWCFAFIALAQFLGFSLTIGAFLAGIALATSPYHYQIQGKVKPLRDFFVALFFIYLGSQVHFDTIQQTLPLIVAYVVYACILKPTIFLLVFGAFGFKKHTIFRIAVNLSQISEFSLIIALMGVKAGVISSAVLSTMALVGVISIVFSSVMISSSKQLYAVLSPVLGFFVRAKLNDTEEALGTSEKMLESHIVVIGAHRVGGQLVEYLKREKINHIIADLNPQIVEELLDKGVVAIYGDISDPEIMDILKLEHAQLIVSTSQDKDDNLHLLAEARRRRVQAPVIARAVNAQDAKLMYKAGADFVILPEILSGDFLTEMLKNNWPNVNYFKQRSDIELRKLSAKHLASE